MSLLLSTSRTLVCTAGGMLGEGALLTVTAYTTRCSLRLFVVAANATYKKKIMLALSPSIFFFHVQTIPPAMPVS